VNLALVCPYMEHMSCVPGYLRKRGSFGKPAGGSLDAQKKGGTTLMQVTGFFASFSRIPRTDQGSIEGNRRLHR